MCSKTLGTGIYIIILYMHLIKAYIIIIDQTISCLSGNKGEILIGTTSGDVIAFSEDDLTQINRFTNV